jgi:orotate phosphoribosyltransferase
MTDAAGQPTSRLGELAGDLRRIGYLVGDLRAEARGGPRTYFEKDLALTRPAVLSRCAELIETLMPDDVDRVAAAGSAPVALATAIALRSSIALLFITSDGHVSGDTFPAARTVLVTDVLLTGATAQHELDVLAAHGLAAISVVALLDRQCGARALLESRGVRVRALVTEHELMSAR